MRRGSGLLLDVDGERREYGVRRGCVSPHGNGGSRSEDIEKPLTGTGERLPFVFELRDRENGLTTNGPKRPHEAEKNVGIVAGKKNLKLFLN